jgi:hypothetical protein
MKTTLIVMMMLALAGSAFAGDEVVRSGAAITEGAESIPVAKVLENPAAYAEKPVVVEGLIVASCANKGCWMQLAPAEGEASVRITFKDYGFFIPLTARGMKARAEGVTLVRTLAKSDADHLEEEGANLTRNEDGSATEISFVATGVEPTK